MDKEDMIEKILEKQPNIFLLVYQTSKIDYLDMSREEIWEKLKEYGFNLDGRKEIAEDIQNFKNYNKKLQNMMKFEIEEIGEKLGLWKLVEKQKRLIENKEK